jgi:hypothetical protein
LGVVSYVILIAIAVAVNHPAVYFLCFLLWFVFLLAIQVGLMFVVVPLGLRAGLSQDLGTALSWPFVRDFLVRMWREQLLTSLFLTATQIPLMLVGIMLCCIGAYAAMALGALASAHLHYQLYELYLTRGGEPIPLKVETLDVVPPRDDR